MDVGYYKVRYYKDCGELPIYNFHKILETNNYAYLVYGWDEYKKVKFNDAHCEELWSNIYEEYCKLSSDNTSLLYYATYLELRHLEIRYHIVSTLLGIMVNGTVLHDKKARKVYIEALRKWNYNIDPNAFIMGEIERMYINLKFSKNKIDLKKDELESFDIDNEEKQTFMQQVVGLEMAMEKNEINTKTTSVLKWVTMILMLKERNEQRRKKAS